MKNFQKNAMTGASAIAVSAVCGIALMLILTLAASAVLEKVSTPEDFYPAVSYAIPVLSSFLSGMLCSLLGRSKGLLRGIVTGITMSCICIITGICIPDAQEVFSMTQMMLRSLIITASAAAGGLLCITFL